MDDGVRPGGRDGGAVGAPQGLGTRFATSLAGSHQGLLGGVTLITVATLASKLLGMLREILIAHWFGASAATDAFLISLLLPVTLSTALGTALATAVAPLYAGLEGSDREDRRRAFMASSVTLVILVGALLGGLFLIGSGTLVRLIAPEAPEATLRTAASLLLPLAPWTLAAILLAYLGGLLQARKNFVLPALGQAGESLAMVAGLLTLVPWMGARALSVSWTAGTSLVALVTFAAYAAVTGFRPRLGGDGGSSRALFVAALPLAALSIVSNSNTLIDRVLGSALPDGSVAALSYAYSLILIPVYLLVIPTTTASLPFLSDAVVRQNWDWIHRFQASASRVVAGALLPCAAFTAVFAEPLVRLIYQRGAFDAGATRSTALCVAAFTPSMVIISYVLILSRTLVAMGGAGRLLLWWTFGVGAKIGASLLLVDRLGATGIAAASAGGLLTTLLLMRLDLRRRLGGTPPGELGRLLVALVSTGAALAVARLLPFAEPAPWPVTLLRGGAFVATAAAAHLALLAEDRRRVGFALQTFRARYFKRSER